MAGFGLLSGLNLDALCIGERDALASTSRCFRHAVSQPKAARCSRQALQVSGLAAAALMARPAPTRLPTPKQALLEAVHSISVAPVKQLQQQKLHMQQQLQQQQRAVAAVSGTSPVARVHSEDELNKVLAADKSKLVVLMCKAKGCRPCKAFSRRYKRIAEDFSDCTFVDIYGDETTNTRKLMISMQVRVTPTFKIFHDGQCIHSHGGINENSLRQAIEEYHPAQ